MSETKPTGIRRLAQRITRRTTDLLAIAIVAVGLLAVGGKLSNWWSTEPATDIAPLPASSPKWGMGGDSVTLEFGDWPWALEKRVIAGDAKEATATLESTVQRLAKTVGVPGPLNDAEKKLLAALAKAEVANRTRDGITMYRMGQSLPMMIATRIENPDGDRTTRVAGWGRAFPIDNGNWMIYAFSPTGESTTSTGDIDIPLPPESRKVHALKDQTGRGWIGFEGEGPFSLWAAHFTKLAATQWQTAQPWTEHPTGWTAVYRKGTSAIRIHITQGGNDRLSGLIVIENQDPKDRDDGQKPGF